MMLKECYKALGGNYEDAVGRLHNEKLVQKFALKFLDDNNFTTLCKALNEGNIEEAFRAAHTIKGICQNLSFTRLAESSSLVTEALRGGNLSGALALLNRLQEDYEITVDAIRVLHSRVSQ